MQHESYLLSPLRSPLVFVGGVEAGVSVYNPLDLSLEKRILVDEPMIAGIPRIKRLGLDRLAMTIYASGDAGANLPNVLIYDLRDWRIESILRGDLTYRIMGLSCVGLETDDPWSPSRVVAGSLRDGLCVWDVTTGDNCGTLDPLKGISVTHTQLQWGSHVFVGGEEMIREFDVSRGSAVAEYGSDAFAARMGCVKGLSTSFEAGLVLAGTDREGFLSWSHRSGEFVSSYPFGVSAYSILCVDDKHQIVVGLTGGKIAVLDLRNMGRLVRQFQVHERRPQYWVYDMDRIDEETFVSVSEDCSVASWKLDGSDTRLVSSSGINLGVSATPGYDDMRFLAMKCGMDDSRERLLFLGGRAGEEILRWVHVSIRISQRTVVVVRLPQSFSGF